MNTTHGDGAAGNVTDMFLWREQRANVRATEAREHHRANPSNADAERYAYEAMTDYVRAARQRNDAERRRREQAAQAIADQLKRGTFFDRLPPGHR